MKNSQPPILRMSRPVSETPWSVWADDVCLGRFKGEPSEAQLQRLATEANGRGWITATVFDVTQTQEIAAGAPGEAVDVETREPALALPA